MTPDRLFVLDLGSRSESILPGVPTCFIDHHRPAGIPPGDVLISSYEWEIIPNTSLLVWDLCSAISDVSDLDWIAAIGLLSDLGESAPFPLLAGVFEKYDRRSLKEATVLVNAIRRASQPDPDLAARALLAYSNPRELVRSTSPEVTRMREARQEVTAAMNEAKKQAPVFAKNVALIRVHSACQVHPLIAQIWRSRLPRYIVVVANEGYLPGRVNFSVRSSQDTNALDFLQAITLPHGEGEYGHGHDQATGGSLPVSRWNQLLTALGFSERFFAPDAI